MINQLEHWISKLIDYNDKEIFICISYIFQQNKVGNNIIK